MDFKSNTNQPAQAQQPSQTQAPQPSVQRAPQAPRGRKGPKLLVALVALVVLVVLAAAAFMLLGGKTSTADAAVEDDKYQALFMTNGQVYFGKLSGLDNSYSELTDVYYLQVQQSVQPSTGTANQPSTQNQAQGTTDASNPQVSLTKLGNELHGPTDKMHIAKDQVLFWENLKDDSTVVKAIKEYQAKQQ